MTPRQPLPAEPSLLQVMYDSVRNLESAIEEVSTDVNTTRLDVARVRTDIAVIKETIRHYDRLQSDVSELKRKMWLISLIGGLAAGTVTLIVGTVVRDKLAPPPVTPPAYTAPHQPQTRNLPDAP